jgi:hypothetical protein
MQVLDVLLEFEKLSSLEDKRFEEINTLYDKLTVELENYAKLGVEINEIQEEIYERLEAARDELISFALNLDISSLSDVRNLLNFWYKLAILEKAKQDILIPDQLVIPVRSYFNKSLRMVS